MQPPPSKPIDNQESNISQKNQDIEDVKDKSMGQNFLSQIPSQKSPVHLSSEPKQISKEEQRIFPFQTTETLLEKIQKDE